MKKQLPKLVVKPYQPPPSIRKQVALLFAEGKTQREIGRLLDRSERRIGQLVQKLKADSRDGAKMRLEAEADRMANAALRAADVAADRGDGSVALELLDRLDVASKKRDAKDSGSKVTIVVGNPGPNALPDFSTLRHFSAFQLPPA